MKIRDAHAQLNGDKTEHTMPSGSLDIISDDGRRLFGISLEKDGSIRVDAGHGCKHGGSVYDDILTVKPVAANVVLIQRPTIRP